MSEKKEDGNTLKLGKKLTLSAGNSAKLAGAAAGGTKTVQVEIKKKRTLTLNKAPEAKPESAEEKNTAVTEQSGLTHDERHARLQALQKAAEKEKQEAEEAKRRELEALHAPKKEEKKKEPAAEEAPELVQPIKSNERIDTSTHHKHKKIAVEFEEKKERPKKAKAAEPDRKRKKITIVEALSDQDEEKRRSLASVMRAREKKKREMQEAGPKEKIYREVILPEIITVQELANRMAERVVDVTKLLMKMGSIATANQTIDADTAELIATELGHKVKRVTETDVEDIVFEDAKDRAEDLVLRAPVVTFMGHVDHGKTSLLDAIRKTKIADKEAGGITQHIGAHQVQLDKKRKITFLDTPGHEAFTAMRQRGAHATDVVVLVVAADDGLMEQTVEAINHARAAEVPIIVAINKIDKPGADVQKTRNGLLEHQLVPEEFGGDTLVVEVSAKTGQGIEDLLETISLQSELLELKANPNRAASGVVIESSMDKNKGVVATLLVQKGTLNQGDIIVAGTAYGKMRALTDEQGKKLKNAGPSTPVAVLGFDEAPEAGMLFATAETEKQARDVTTLRKKRDRDLKAAKDKPSSLEELFQKSAEGSTKTLPIVIKADVQGSAEAIKNSLEKLSNDEISVKILHEAVGGITNSDVSLASASGAIILGFNVRSDNSTKELAEKEGIDIRYYSIIYDLIDDMKAILGGMLAPIIRENYLGVAEIREVFSVSKAGKVAGCYVTDGMIKRGAGVRLLRDNVVIHQGKLKTLRRFKDDVKEVGVNFECGMAFENYDDIKTGDKIEAFEEVEEQRKL